MFVVYKQKNDLKKIANISKNKLTSVAIAAANDNSVSEAVGKIVMGKATARSPFNNKNHAWTNSKLDALDKAIAEVKAL